MTTPTERAKAIIATEKWLRGLASGNAITLKLAREDARHLLRHYPTAGDAERWLKHDERATK